MTSCCSCAPPSRAETSGDTRTCADLGAVVVVAASTSTVAGTATGAASRTALHASVIPISFHLSTDYTTRWLYVLVCVQRYKSGPG